MRLPGEDTELLGIDRAAERLASEAAARLGIGPGRGGGARGLSGHGLHRLRSPCSAAESAERAEELARALRRFHDSGVRLPTSFCVPDLLEDYAAIVRARGGELPGAYADALFAAAQDRRRSAASRRRPCHDDLLAGEHHPRRRATAAS